MIITNHHNIPAPLYWAIVKLNNEYDRGESDFTVTELCGPPQIARLKREHGDTLEVDASDLIYRTLGTAMHKIVMAGAEVAAEHGFESITEERLYETFIVEDRPWKIGGQYDLIYRDEAGKLILLDWKLMSIWEAKNGLKPEKVWQANMLAHLARYNGYEVTGLEVGGWFRDWSKVQAHKRADHPSRQSETFPVPMWEDEACELFIEERIQHHLSLPECTVEDRWAKEEGWAVMKKGRKSALKVHRGADAMAQAHSDASSRGAGHFVEHRPSEETRCLWYCDLSEICPQRQAMLEAESDQNSVTSGGVSHEQ